MIQRWTSQISFNVKKKKKIEIHIQFYFVNYYYNFLTEMSNFLLQSISFHLNSSSTANTILPGTFLSTMEGLDETQLQNALQLRLNS